jgi:hypothetical protein
VTERDRINTQGAMEGDTRLKEEDKMSSLSVATKHGMSRAIKPSVNVENSTSKASGVSKVMSADMHVDEAMLHAISDSKRREIERITKKPYTVPTKYSTTSAASTTSTTSAKAESVVNEGLAQAIVDRKKAELERTAKKGSQGTLPVMTEQYRKDNDDEDLARAIAESNRMEEERLNRINENILVARENIKQGASSKDEDVVQDSKRVKKSWVLNGHNGPNSEREQRELQEALEESAKMAEQERLGLEVALEESAKMAEQERLGLEAAIEASKHEMPLSSPLSNTRYDCAAANHGIS